MQQQSHYAVLCVFGAGNAMDRNNHAARGRVAKAWQLVAGNIFCAGVEIAFLGCHQPNMKDTSYSEAQTMERYLHILWRKGARRAYAPDALQHIRNVDAPSINSTSATCAFIAQEYLNVPRHVYLVTSWYHIPRTYYLMRKQAIHAGHAWPQVRGYIHLVGAGGVLLPYLRRGDFLTPFKTMVRESGAWVKAILDPHSKWINQSRWA